MFADVSDHAPTANPYLKLYDYDGSGNLIYEGWAKPGVALASALWAVRRYTYTGSNLTKIDWANGTSAEQNVWNNRASLTYA